MRILYIDDETMQRHAFATLIRHSGMEATLAESAESALLLCDSESFDAVLTDIHMPEIDGLEFGQIFRKRFPATPLFACVDEYRLHPEDTLAETFDRVFEKQHGSSHLVAELLQHLLESENRD